MVAFVEPTKKAVSHSLFLIYFLFKASKRLAKASKSLGSSAGETGAGVDFFKGELVGISGKSNRESSSKSGSF